MTDDDRRGRPRRTWYRERPLQANDPGLAGGHPAADARGHPALRARRGVQPQWPGLIAALLASGHPRRHGAARLRLCARRPAVLRAPAHGNRRAEVTEALMTN